MHGIDERDLEIETFGYDASSPLYRWSLLSSVTVKRLTRAGLGFKSFSTARRTIDGYETMHMIRKGQVMGIAKEAIKEQGAFIEELFEIAA